jgi:hypothetical protein
MAIRFFDKLAKCLGAQAAFGTALAERSGDSAFVRTQNLRSTEGPRPDESGVALRLPPQSKMEFGKSGFPRSKRMSFEFCQTAGQAT